MARRPTPPARSRPKSPSKVVPRSKPRGRVARALATAKPTVPDRIYAQASPRSFGGVSLFEAQGQISASTVTNFMSEDDVVMRAASQLHDAGFEVLQASSISINIAGSKETFQRAFKTTIVAQERPVIKELAIETTATFLDSPDTDMLGLINVRGTPFEETLEGVAIEEPRYFMAASMFPPTKSYWHLSVPAGISLGLNADRAHRGGTTGKGIRVAMCDSGHFKHPFFTGRGYRVAPVTLGPGAVDPNADESGHGTGESANIFAVAPDCDLLPVKMSFVNSIGGFNAAVGLSPHIITCSWGSSKQFGPLSAADQALAAAIASAVASGIIVIFSAGNGHWGFPGQHPDVISAGGVFMNPDETLRASDYASGFMSNIYPNRRVPDASGLVGMLPSAAYIMLPVEPGDEIDTDLAGGTHPNNDETANNDGWAAFSGTSAAAPQLAGAAALIKQACAGLTPPQVRSILMNTARDVTAGNANANTGGNPAGPGPDLATGNGLIDVHKAVLSAKVQCLGPITPITTITPVTPVTPITGITPITPITTITPITAITPIGPTPITPITAITPIGPTPITPIGPTPITPIRPSPIRPRPPVPPGPPGPPILAPEIPTQPQHAAHAAQSRLSREDVEALQKMIGEGSFKLED